MLKYEKGTADERRLTPITFYLRPFAFIRGSFFSIFHVALGGLAG
jgi:hypothetical protein